MEKRVGGEIGGGGLGLGVELTIRIGELKSGLDMLTDALKETGEAATDLLADAVSKIREAGVGDLQKKLSEQGKGGEEQEVYNRIVTNLQNAANRGEEEARALLRDLGEKV